MNTATPTSTETNINTYRRQLIYGIFYLCIFLFSVFLTSHQFDSINHGSKEYRSDFNVHLNSAMAYYDEDSSYLPHPVWHVMVNKMSNITLSPTMAGSLITALLVVIWAYIIHQLCHFYFNRHGGNSPQAPPQNTLLSDGRNIAIITATLVIGPVYLPFFNPYIILGQGSPNLWHNPTLLAVKPFALAAIFFSIMYMREGKWVNYVAAAGLLTLSMFAKPSFAIAFIPALGFYIVARNYWQWPRVIFGLSMLGLFIAVSLYQYINFYTASEGVTNASGGGNIIIDWFNLWSMISPNVFVSIIIALAFPLAFLILTPKLHLKDDFLVLSWIMIIGSILTFGMIAEGGAHYQDGNFAWGYSLSMSILYVFSLIKYARHCQELSRLKNAILGSLLVYQLGVGIYYSQKLLTGQFHL